MADKPPPRGGPSTSTSRPTTTTAPPTSTRPPTSVHTGSTASTAPGAHTKTSSRSPSTVHTAPAAQTSHTGTTTTPPPAGTHTGTTIRTVPKSPTSLSSHTPTTTHTPATTHAKTTTLRHDDPRHDDPRHNDPRHNDNAPHDNAPHDNDRPQSQTCLMTATTWPRPARRRNELGMIILVLVLTGGLYSLSSLGTVGSLPANIIPFLVLVAALMLVAHVALRRLAPQADPVLLPLAALLNGFGYVFIASLNSAEASAQATWTLVGVIAFVATLALFPRAVILERYRFSFALAGVTLLVLPLVPHIGEDVNGARLWVHVGPLNFQPEEFAKLALAIFFASVLAERADLLATGTRRIGRWLVLEPRYMAPLVGAWGVSLLILLAENDLGSSFLFFALFVGLLWVATGKWAYLVLGGGLFTAGAVFALDFIHHAQTRVQAWLDPWSHFATSGYQIIEGWFALATGGLWGVGRPGEPRRDPGSFHRLYFRRHRGRNRPGWCDRAPDRLLANGRVGAEGCGAVPAVVQQAPRHRIFNTPGCPGVRCGGGYNPDHTDHGYYPPLCFVRGVITGFQLHLAGHLAENFARQCIRTGHRRGGAARQQPAGHVTAERLARR